jgi:hypothetical protein
MMISRTLAYSAVVALAAMAAASWACAETNAFGRSPALLEGSWEVTVKPRDCITGDEAPLQGWVRSYLTFSAGGTMFETTSNPWFRPGQRGPGHGYWVRTGTSTYDAVVQAFIQFTTDPPAALGPTYTRGSQRIEQAIEMSDADHWHSAADVRFRDADGNPVDPSGCASAAATRMP